MMGWSDERRVRRFIWAVWPLLMLVAAGDHLVPSELAIAAFDTAPQPRELVILPGGHFDAYVKGFDVASGQARDWFTRHLA